MTTQGLARGSTMDGDGTAGAAVEGMSSRVSGGDNVMTHEMALVLKEGVPLQLGQFRLDQTGLVVQGEPTFEEWEKVGAFLLKIEASNRWWRGDWILYGETRDGWGDHYEHACSELGLEYSTVRNLKSISKQFQLSRRRDNLGWDHHEAVAGLPEKEQERLLDLAETVPLTYRELRKVVRDVRHEAKRLLQTWPEGTYGLIYCDPPWRAFDGTLDPTRQIENQYPTMTVEELVAMADQSPSGEPGGVKAIIAPNCVLAIWTIASKLDECCQVIRAWGFEVQIQAIWVKDRIGMGHWFRQRHETLILATTGTPLTPPESHRPDSIIEAPRRGHSEKPDEVYPLLEGMFAGVRKVELFHRGEPRPGWDTWGNECVPLEHVRTAADRV